MPIGQGADYYNGINREEDKRVKLGEVVEEWWDSLDHNEKVELMDDCYPDHSHLLDVDEMWIGLDWSDRLDIWRREIGYDEVQV